MTEAKTWWDEAVLDDFSGDLRIIADMLGPAIAVQLVHDLGGLQIHTRKGLPDDAPLTGDLALLAEAIGEPAARAVNDEFPLCQIYIPLDGLNGLIRRLILRDYDGRYTTLCRMARQFRVSARHFYDVIASRNLDRKTGQKKLF